MTTRWDWTGLSDKLGTDELIRAMNGRMRAMSRSLDEVMMGTVNALDYVATVNGLTDNTAGLQAAINTGKTVVFPPGVYRAVGLTQSTNQQQFIGLGNAELKKNGDGVILATTGNGVECHNLGFRGDAASPTYTGDNVTFTGESCGMWNCFSMWAYGRAVKATGGHFRIFDTAKWGVYQTTDATATGYDIEIGVSGTATLYHQLNGVYTSQATGGLYLVDVGAASIHGGQVGKVTIASGTGPAGSGANMMMGTRVVGDVTIGLSSQVIEACAFSAVDIVFELGTSGCRFGASNVLATGATITNNGNANNLILREVSTGTYNDLKIGDDTSTVILRFSPSATGDIRLLPNGVEAVRVDGDATAGNTRFMVYDVDNGTLERVSVGIADSGGGGFKVLRIPN